MQNSQEFLIGFPFKVILLYIQHRTGCVVKGENTTGTVKEYYPGINAFKDGLHAEPSPVRLLVGLFKRLFAFLDVVKHFIEGVYQQADFIIPSQGNPEVEIPFCYRVSCLGQGLYGNGDTLGDPERYPQSKKYDQQCSNGEHHEVDKPDRVLLSFHLNIFIVRPLNGFHFIDDIFGDQ